jgi:hypothetical protein
MPIRFKAESIFAIPNFIEHSNIKSQNFTSSYNIVKILYLKPPFLISGPSTSWMLLGPIHRGYPYKEKGQFKKL